MRNFFCQFGQCHPSDWCLSSITRETRHLEGTCDGCQLEIQGLNDANGADGRLGES